MDYSKDYYAILELDEKASENDIRSAYRRLAKIHHPDKNPGDPAAEERFKAINEANEVLSHPVTRHVYDSYRAAANKAATPPKEEQNTSQRKRKVRTYKVYREKKIYVTGQIEIKFQGEPHLSNAIFRNWERHFNILPTETLATIVHSQIYQHPPEKYKSGYSEAQLFTTPISQPVLCRVLEGEHEAYYHLFLNDIRIVHPRLTGITRHDQYSFGTLKGEWFGYVLHQEEDTVTEEIDDIVEPTGVFETKEEGEQIWVRQEFRSAAGPKTWTDWKAYEGFPAGRKRAAQPIVQHNLHCGTLSWLILLLSIGLIWPPFLFVALPAIGIIVLSSVAGALYPLIGRALPFIAAIIFITLIIAGELEHKKTSSPQRRARYDTIDTRNTGSQQGNDSSITHFLRWEDADSNRYHMTITLPYSILQKTNIRHLQMKKQDYALQGMPAVYQDLSDNDEAQMGSIALYLDSIATARKLSSTQKAAMAVSCVQSIPYTLVVDGACLNNSNDQFIQQYLANCTGDCCVGHIPFGVQSPVEFLGNLKGDCDTRSLFLYTLLGKMGYHVALLTSEQYRHALIAVQLDHTPELGTDVFHINNKNFYLWETTAKNHLPGRLPAAVSGLSNWNIALIQ